MTDRSSHGGIFPTARLTQLWNGLRASLWFVPSLFVAAGIGLAFALIEVDARLDPEVLERWPRVFGAGAEGARSMLSAVAGSIITVVGVTFSITIVALSLASSQYSPRVLRNFMRDRANQAVLGVFSGVFAYCLIVLRTVYDADDGGFVPAVAVVGAVVLALVSVGFLIFFIHHVANSIQASTIIAAVMKETVHAANHLFPENLGDEMETDPEEMERRLAATSWEPLPAPATGYVQTIDTDGLIAVAAAHDTVLRMEHGVGEFVVEGTPLAFVPTSGLDVKAMADDLRGVYAISRYRTVEQDPAFGIRQLVDIAMKALSPGINDTTTAVTCVDYLAAILSRLAVRRVEAPYRYDGTGLRVIAKSPSFEDLVDLAFDQIRQNAEANAAVLIRLLAAIETVGELVRSRYRRTTLLKHVDLIAEAAGRALASDYEREAVAQHEARARAALKRKGAPVPSA